MSARLRSSLHPLTVASIDMQRDNCCGSPRSSAERWWLCDYHQGFQDGIDQLLESEGRSDG